MNAPVKQLPSARGDRLVDAPLEERILGTVVADLELIEEHGIDPEDFGSQLVRRCMRAANQIRISGRIASREAFREAFGELKLHGLLELDPWDRFPDRVEDLDPALRRIRDLALRRRVRLQGERVVRFASSPDVTVEDLRQHLDDAADELDSRLPVEKASLADLAHENARKALRGEIIERTTKTGIPDLDLQIAGWTLGDIVVWLAETSVGKTTTMLIAAVAQALNGVPTALLSFEDGRRRFASRATFVSSGIPPVALRRTLSKAQVRAIDVGAKRLGDLPVDILFAEGGTLHSVHEALESALRGGARVVYVDYIQAIKKGGDRDSYREFLRDLFSLFRRALRRYPGAVLVAASQVNSGAEQYQCPTILSPYEGKVISQAADQMVGIWRTKKGDRAWRVIKGKDGAGYTGRLVITRGASGLAAFRQLRKPLQEALPTDEGDAFDE